MKFKKKHYFILVRTTSLTMKKNGISTLESKI